jgi:hypothetical protein
MRDRVFINLRDAYLCADCEAIGNGADHCARCLSEAVILVSRIVSTHDPISVVYLPLAGEKNVA